MQLSTEDYRRVVQAVLDASDLQQYYHVDVPGRQKLMLVVPPSAPNDLGITKFGNTVAIVAADEVDEDVNYIDLTRVVADQGSVRVEFIYPVEGVSGSALLVKVDNEWTLRTLDLAEY